MRAFVFVLFLKGLQAFDRARLRIRMALRPGLEVDSRAGSNFASAHYSLGPGARLRIAAGAATDRRRGALRFVLGPGAVVNVGENAWLRTAIGPVTIVAFDGARIEIGDDAFLNGAYLSAKSEVRIGRHASVGPGSRVFDADQHDLDNDRLEQSAPVRIGDYTWVASDVTILRGVTIGEHSVVGTRSLVTGDIPSHTLAFGVPARSRGEVGDRSRAR
jgi:acetyltransferase-like isoleucine patch superfamily enzyme